MPEQNISHCPKVKTANIIRNEQYRGPIAHLPGHKKPSVAIKCSPILYELRKVQPPSANSDYRPTASSTTASTPGAPTTSEKAQEVPKIPSVFGLGYRSVYAVATQDSVLIYDTQQTAALALVSHLHYATFTDMTWSSDGCNLILTSSDGFCSIISFDEGELGAIYTPPPSMIALLPTSESGLSSALTAEPLDVSAAVAATAGMLQKLNGLSLTEQKAKGKQGDKNESAPETGKKGGKKASKAARNTASAAAAATATATAITPASSAKTSSAPSSSPKASGKLSFKTERDGDSVMGSVQEPTPKKRRIQPFLVSPLPGSSSPGTSQSSSQGSTATPSPAPSSSPAPSPAMASTSLFATPGTTSAPVAKPKKRIQPTFVSALPGH